MVIITYSERKSIITRHWKIILLGFFIRIIFAPFTGHPYDLPIWMDSGITLANGNSPYNSYIHIGQTILFTLWTAFSYILSNSLSVFDPFLYITLIKILPIISDLLLPIEIIILLKFGFNKKIDIKMEKNIIYGIMINPFLIIVSSFWAMTDSLAFLILIITINQIYRKRILLAGIIFSFSISLKLYPVVLIPALALIILWKFRNIFYSIIFTILSLFFFLLTAFLPFFLFSWDTQQIFGVLTSQIARAPGGLSPLGIITNLTADNPFSDFFLKLFMEISSFQFIYYFWMICIFLFSIYYFIIGPRNWFPLNRIIKIQNKEEFVNSRVIDLLINFFLLWAITTVWVSEQNFIFLIMLIYIKYFIILIDSDKNKQTDLKSKSQVFFEIYWLLTLIVFLFIFFNVPIFAFFYLFLDELLELSNHIILLRMRVLALTGFAILLIAEILNLISYPRFTNSLEKFIPIFLSLIISGVVTTGVFLYFSLVFNFYLGFNVIISSTTFLLIFRIFHKIITSLLYQRIIVYFNSSKFI